MAEYVKVMATLKDEEGNVVDTLKEIIRLECLRKVVRWSGDAGTEICFEWFDEKQNAERQWIYDCGTDFIRECLFTEYEKQLCGCVKRWER